MSQEGLSSSDQPLLRVADQIQNFIGKSGKVKVNNDNNIEIIPSEEILEGGLEDLGQRQNIGSSVDFHPSL
jgi:hypothetical protein